MTHPLTTVWTVAAQCLHIWQHTHTHTHSAAALRWRCRCVVSRAVTDRYTVGVKVEINGWNEMNGGGERRTLSKLLQQRICTLRLEPWSRLDLLHSDRRGDWWRSLRSSKLSQRCRLVLSSFYVKFILHPLWKSDKNVECECGNRGLHFTDRVNTLSFLNSSWFLDWSAAGNSSFHALDLPPETIRGS